MGDGFERTKYNLPVINQRIPLFVKVQSRRHYILYFITMLTIHFAIVLAFGGFLSLFGDWYPDNPKKSAFFSFVDSIETAMMGFMGVLILIVPNQYWSNFMTTILTIIIMIAPSGFFAWICYERNGIRKEIIFAFVMFIMINSLTVMYLYFYANSILVS